MRPLFANANSICCSGRAAIAGTTALPVGVLGDSLGLPTASGFPSEYKRFISGGGTEDQGTNNNASFYDLGVKWNQDVYCIPE